MDYDFKWIRPNMSLYHIDKNSPCIYDIGYHDIVLLGAK